MKARPSIFHWSKEIKWPFKWYNQAAMGRHQAEQPQGPRGCPQPGQLPGEYWLGELLSKQGGYGPGEAANQQLFEPRVSPCTCWVSVEMALSSFSHLYSGKVVSTHFFHSQSVILTTVNFPPPFGSPPRKSCGAETKVTML